LLLCPDTRNPPSIASCFEMTDEPPFLATASFSVTGGSASLATEIVSEPAGRASHATSVSLLSASFFGSPSGRLIENAIPPTDPSTGFSSFPVNDPSAEPLQPPERARPTRANAT